MDLSLRHAFRYMIYGLGVISLQVWAEVDASKSASGAKVSGRSGQAIDLFMLEWGLLIGVVLLALVVVARKSNAP